MDFDFGIKPKNRIEGLTEEALTKDKYKYCKFHRQTPVSYFCKYSKDFYCKLCVGPKHANHDGDVPLADIQEQVQLKLNNLKTSYLTKRTYTLDRMTQHMNNLEDHFQLYYDQLDKMR